MLKKVSYFDHKLMTLPDQALIFLTLVDKFLFCFVLFFIQVIYTALLGTSVPICTGLPV